MRALLIQYISIFLIFVVISSFMFGGANPFSCGPVCGSTPLETYQNQNITIPLPVPTNPDPQKEMVFYATPKKNLIDSYNVETNDCSMPQNEAFYIKKSQITAVPDCRLSTLRSTFEKNVCHLPFVNREPLVS